ncbi:OTU domain-containing protein [Pseudomonas monteilii]|uniref:HNH endonuclease n=1 Tax=Pseudomonas monteilii TaxID=76759 RepID=UPI0015F88E73|nr:HNH endonuclease [Pseudomonas monteilii]MBA6105307.1 HNH endonuclease [Pseudomonas monteilii]
MNELSEQDPAAVDPDKVVPRDGLGTGFETPAYPALYFSTKSQIWGDKSGTEVEPVLREFKSADTKRKTLTRDGHRCLFCGFHSVHNQVHNLTDNHQDIREHNLRAVDHLCHGWQHLGELGEGNAVIAYLPGLSGQDVNHLQRTLMIALQSDDETVRTDAKQLLNWLGSHYTYTDDAWGTYSPAVFAKALLRQNESEKGRRELVFEDLAVVFNPGPYSQVAGLWMREYQSAYPIAKWADVFFSVMNPPV